MATAASPSQTFTTEADKKKLLARLARVEGQIRGVQRMIEGEEDCEKIAQQLSAARSALNRAFFELMACAFERKLGSEGGVARRRVADLATLLSKYA